MSEQRRFEMALDNYYHNEKFIQILTDENYKLIQYFKENKDKLEAVSQTRKDKANKIKEVLGE